MRHFGFLSVFLGVLMVASPGSTSELRMATGKVKAVTDTSVTIASQNDGNPEDAVFQISNTTLFFRVVDDKFLADNPKAPMFCAFANVARTDASILGQGAPIAIYYRPDERTALAIRDQGVVGSFQGGSTDLVYEDPRYPECPFPMRMLGLSIPTH